MAFELSLSTAIFKIQHGKRNGRLVSNVNTVQFLILLQCQILEREAGTDSAMADEGFDLCECIWSDEMAMQRLLSILRQSQSYCTDNECFSMSRLPGPRGVPPSSNFFMTCLIIAFAVLMYVLRPNTLRRLRNETTKNRDNEHDSNDGPPAPPPPTAQ